MADTTLYKQIVLEWGQDTDSLIWGMGYSPDNGEHFYVLNTTYGRKYRTEDGDRIWPFIVDKVKAVLEWSEITNKPDLALKTDLTWSNITNKPDVALKSDVAAVSAVASNASAKADSNAKLIADKASQEDLNNVSSTASSALDKATSNANALSSKVNKSDLTWTNITNRPDVDKIASQASQAVVTANTAQSQASAAGQAASSASAQASAAKASADTATATANAAKASASTASATAASAQQVANSASASASATAVALKSKADTDTVNAQFTAVNSSVASAQSTADSAVAGLDNKLDKTALTWGNIANKPTNLATTDSVAKAQSAVNSAVSMASGATATANSAKSAATSAVGVANTANTTANSALAKANSAVSVASQANSNASSAANTANQAKSTADSVNSRLNDMQIGGRNLASGTNLEYAMGYGIPTTTWEDGYAYLKLPANTINGEILPQNTHTFYHTLTKGTTYTQTIWFETDAKLINSSGIKITWFTNVGHDIQSATLINLGENKYKLYSTYMWPGKSDNDVRLFDTEYLDYAFDLSTGTYFKFGKLKLEEGNVSTDWTPAPEDIQSEIDANKTAAANAQTSASNAQNTANSAQSTANTAIKVSETLKDLGNYTATASGTTANSPTTGLPRTSGVSMTQVYNNGYPTSYGNVLNIAGNGTGQLLLGWSGNDNTTEHLWYRSHRDTSTGGWGTWQKIAYVSDLTWSNISGKPDVATKSDLTWANISGKPSIPDADATTTVSSGDLNNYTTTGKYYMPNSLANYTNHPTTGTDMGDWFVMKVDVYKPAPMIVQTIYQVNSGDVWVRTKFGSNAWKSWRQINFWG